MVYRNGTYIAFHAEGKTDPTASDIKYYRLMKAWHVNDGIDFKFVNSHDKVEAVADGSSRKIIMASLRDRLDNSKHMILLIGPKTREDDDFVPYEIQYAVDICEIPLIIVYTEYSGILNPKGHRNEWPEPLKRRIDNSTVKAIHIPFKRSLIDAAIGQFDFNKPPSGALSYYSRETQEKHGVVFNR